MRRHLASTIPDCTVPSVARPFAIPVTPFSGRSRLADVLVGGVGRLGKGVLRGRGGGGGNACFLKPGRYVPSNLAPHRRRLESRPQRRGLFVPSTLNCVAEFDAPSAASRCAKHFYPGDHLVARLTIADVPTSPARAVCAHADCTCRIAMTTLMWSMNAELGHNCANVDLWPGRGYAAGDHFTIPVCTAPPSESRARRRAERAGPPPGATPQASMETKADAASVRCARTPFALPKRCSVRRALVGAPLTPASYSEPPASGRELYEVPLPEFVDRCRVARATATIRSSLIRLPPPGAALGIDRAVGENAVTRIDRRNLVCPTSGA